MKNKFAFLLLILTVASSLIAEQTVSGHDLLSLYFHQHDEKAIKCGLVSPQILESLKTSQNLNDRMLAKDITQRPQLQTYYFSPEGHFKIHYDTTGTNAPEPVYSLDPSVPDWIILTAGYAEQAWRLLMDTLGYQPPPADGVDGDQVDLYVLNLNGNAYAWTYPTSPVLNTPQPFDYFAYTEIDNDYQETRYDTHGENALKVTLAHEFFHIVQLGYNFFPAGIGGSAGDQYFLEMSSVWFEERAHPDVNDYIQYTAAYLYNPIFPLWNSTYWYALGIYIHYLTYLYGDHFLTQTWDEIKDREAFYALDKTLSGKGSSVAETWRDFGIRAYFVGSKFDGNDIFPDASDYPDMDLSPAFSGNLEETWSQDFDLNGFCTTFFRISTGQRCRAEVSFSDIQGIISGAAVLTKSGTAGIRNVNNSGKTRIDDFSETDELLITAVDMSEKDEAAGRLNIRQVVNPFVQQGIYPNPFFLSAESEYPSVKIIFNTSAGKGKIVIFNLLGQKLAESAISTDDLQEGEKNISLREPLKQLQSNYLASGIYFVKVKIDNQSFVLKMTILK